jgi:hypothetical protein
VVTRGGGRRGCSRRLGGGLWRWRGGPFSRWFVSWSEGWLGDGFGCLDNDRTNTSEEEVRKLEGIVEHHR